MANTTSLFDLPGELRNRIYEYVLSAPEGILCYREPHSIKYLAKPIFEIPVNLRFIKVAVKPAREYNRLQYVNRQLRKETGGLELLYNTLTFTCDYNDRYASTQLLSFLDSISPGRASWPLKIAVEDWVGRGRDANLVHGAKYAPKYPFTDPISTVAEVSRRCRNNPQIRITWRLSRLRYLNLDFVERALQVSYIARPRPLTDLYKDVEDEAWHVECAEHDRKGIDVQDLSADNLVFLPMLQFNREACQAAVQTNRGIRLAYHPEKIHALLEGWYTNGI